MKCDFKRIIEMKTIIVFVFVFILTGAALVGFNAYIEDKTIDVILITDGFEAQISTMEQTVGSLLDKYDIKLKPGDEVEPAKTKLLEEGDTIKVRRAIEVWVAFDGSDKPVHMITGTVSDALQKAGAVLSDLDETNYDLETLISPGMVISITRVRQESIVKKDAIPYQVVVKNDNNQDESFRRVVQQGQQGELHREYKVVYRDGEEISRELVEEKVATQPIDHIVRAGTLQRKITSRGDNIRYVFSRVFEVTAYTHTGNPTRTGVMPQIGHVAVDPDVIPLNSTIYIDFSGRWNHLDGFYKATDTGGVIIGDIVDIFMDTEDEAIRFGRRRARVYLVR